MLSKFYVTKITTKNKENKALLMGPSLNNSNKLNGH
jgi:hypothetical protein